MSASKACLVRDEFCMIRSMIRWGLYLFWALICLCITFQVQAELLPEHVAVVYNKRSVLSKRMAEEYVKVRGIPAGNVVELDCPITNEITRSQYEDLIKLPLSLAAVRGAWWRTSFSGAVVTSRRVYAMVLMADLPMKIKHELPIPRQGKPINLVSTDQASVDSELSMLMVGQYQLQGAAKNLYFNKVESIVGCSAPVLLVTRIDAITQETCMDMIRVPIQVEARGLWGWSVVDRGGPYKQGDAWLDAVVERMRKAGVPVYLDTWSATLPERFPMSLDVAVYCGWYTRNANGPFLDPAFRFRPGAIAMHLHSFSAANFKNPTQGWSSSLLEKGAAVTIGNVYEPFLGNTHRFDIMMDRLLEGFSVAEAAWMSMPVCSWQGVVFGDPLYRPFAKMKNMDVSPNDADRFFQGWWASRVQFEDDWASRVERLEQAAQKAPQSFLYEAIAHEFLLRKEWDKAAFFFQSALAETTDSRNFARLSLSALLPIMGKNGSKSLISELEKLKSRMLSSPWLPAVNEWYKRVAPPPPNPNKK